MPLRLLLGLAPATVIALALLAGTAAAAKKRCCFKLTAQMFGTSTSTWGQPPARVIGADSVRWQWIERMIVVYHEQSGSSDLRLARVRPSSAYTRSTSSSVQIKHALSDTYYAAAEPGTCGNLEITARQGDLPSLYPRSSADEGALAHFPKAKYFLSVGSSQAREDDGCTYRPLYRAFNYLEFGTDQPCGGQYNFSLPAPRRAWFRRGKGRIQKDVLCVGGRQPAPPNINNTVDSVAVGHVALAWFPPKKLKKKARRLKEIHKKLVLEGFGRSASVASVTG